MSEENVQTKEVDFEYAASLMAKRQRLKYQLETVEQQIYVWIVENGGFNYGEFD